MSKQPEVSFLIPAKNRPLELKAALGSCLAQSLENWEAIVVDDHSDPKRGASSSDHASADT